jgi:hypothetical protein
MVLSSAESPAGFSGFSNFGKWRYKPRRDTIKPGNERRTCINYQKLKYQPES